MAVILGVFIGADFSCLAGRTISNHALRHASPALFALGCAILMLLGLSFTLFCLVAARSMWFYLYAYRVDDNRVEVTTPFLGKRYSIDLSKVRRITTFVVFGADRSANGRIGHMLMGEDGCCVKLSEALSSWGWISSQCSSASIEPRPHPWWEIIR